MNEEKKEESIGLTFMNSSLALSTELKEFICLYTIQEFESIGQMVNKHYQNQKSH